MDETLPWYREMPAESRSWVGLVAQAGVAAFVDWFRDPSNAASITADVFGTAPRELARVVSRSRPSSWSASTIDVVEEQVDELAAPGDEALLREAVLRYSREIAFAAAQVYAAGGRGPRRLGRPARGAGGRRAAARRGRRGAAVPGRRARLGRPPARSPSSSGRPRPDREPEAVVERDPAGGPRTRSLDVLAGVQGDRLVAVLGGVTDPLRAARSLLGQFGRGPVVVGPVVPDLLPATRSAAAALAGLRAVRAWPDAPRPVLADDLLPERALAGDPTARRPARRRGLPPLADAGGGAARDRWRRSSSRRASLEAAARALFVHPNTVRYRLRRVAEVTGVAPTDPRGARSPCGSRWPSAGSADARGRRRRSCRKPTKSARRSSSSVDTAPRPLAHGRLDGARHRRSRPGRPDPRLPAPGSSCPASRTGCAGCRPSPGSTWSTTAPRPTPTTSGHRGGPAAAGGRRAGRRCSSSSRTRPTRSAWSAPAPGTASARSPPPPAAGSSPPSRRWSSSASAAGRWPPPSAVTPTGMTAVLGGDPDEVARQLAEHGLTAANVNGAGQIVAAGTLEQLEALAADPPRGRARPPAAGRRRVPHRAHGSPPSTTLGRLRPRRHARTTRAPACSPTPTAPSSTTAARCSRRIVAQVSNPVRWDLCMQTMARPRRHRRHRAAAGRHPAGLVKRALPGVETVALKTPDDLEAARDLVARHGSRSPARTTSRPGGMLVAPAKGIVHVAARRTPARVLGAGDIVGTVVTSRDEQPVVAPHGGTRHRVARRGR